MTVSARRLAIRAISLAVALPVMAWAGSNYSTVNSSIRVGSGTAAGKVDSVNGAIRIGADSLVESIESVNGSIDISQGVSIERDIEAVNGSIELDDGSEVGGRIKTVNGAIRMRNTHVAGDIQTINGGINLQDGSVVGGDIVVRKPRGWFNNRRHPVTVEIGENVQVHGNLVFEQPVELRLHASARVGEVIGDEVTLVE